MQHAYVDFRDYRLEAVLDREVNVRKGQHVELVGMVELVDVV